MACTYWPCFSCAFRYDTKNTTGAVACTIAVSTSDAGVRSNVVVGFNLNDPTQAGSFYTVVGVVALVGLCAIAVLVQVNYDVKTMSSGLQSFSLMIDLETMFAYEFNWFFGHSSWHLPVLLPVTTLFSI